MAIDKYQSPPPKKNRTSSDPMDKLKFNLSIGSEDVLFFFGIIDIYQYPYPLDLKKSCFFFLVLLIFINTHIHWIWRSPVFVFLVLLIHINTHNRMEINL